MNCRVLALVGFALIAACGGSVTNADDAGRGEGGSADDAGRTGGGSADDAGRGGGGDGDEGGGDAAVRDADVSEAAPLVDVVDSAAPTCGVAGQACCGTSCNAGNVCVVIDRVSQCEACGEPGQPCCTTVPACAAVADGCFFSGSLQYCLNNSVGTPGQPGDRCSPTCADPTTTCVDNGMTSYCVACGGLGNPCCGTTCAASLQCTAGACQ
jgi:hypothetical protein